MNKEQAKKILEKNVLNDLFNSLDDLPIYTIDIDSFSVSKTDGDYAYLLGVIKKTKKSKSDFFCSSFFVLYNDSYYYRETFSGAIEVIVALRTLNNFERKYDDEGVNIII